MRLASDKNPEARERGREEMIGRAGGGGEKRKTTDKHYLGESAAHKGEGP